MLVISHDRDLLDDVANHILHLDRGKLTLWSGGYSSFERQRAEMMALQGKAAKKQEERRKHLQSFVDRFRASATKATPGAVAPQDAGADGADRGRRSTSQRAAVLLAAARQAAAPRRSWRWRARRSATTAARCCRASASTLQADDRIGLIGANGNGKSTFAKLMGGRLALLSGKMVRAAEAGGRLLRPASGRRSRARRQRLQPRRREDARRAGGEDPRAASPASAFPPARADTPVAQLSGGEKARLLMGLATFDGPQLLILDEPTNHLDIDSRAALVEAINDYEGACILISHDRDLLEACADRLWLVAAGQVRAFDGDLDDYAKSGARRAGANRSRGAAQDFGAAARANALARTANRRRRTEDAAFSGSY